MDAIDLLKEDHKELKHILDEGEKASGREQREQLYKWLSHKLETHERMEEQVLYPALKEHPKAKDIVLEGYEEHHVADVILAELGATDYSDETWPAQWKVLKESLEHHIEEEEGEMFKKAKKVFEDTQLEKMGAAMEKIRASYS